MPVNDQPRVATSPAIRARVWAAAVVAACNCVQPAHATGPDEAWHAEARSVLELLQADTRRALMAAGAHTAPTSPAVSAAPNSAPAARVELVALYGTAGALTAMVEVDGVRKEYRPGASLPLGGGSRASEYRLVRIVDDCVVLRRDAGALRTACFSRKLAAGDAGQPGQPGKPRSGSVLDLPLPTSLR